MDHPVLRTARLILRRPELCDTDAIQSLLKERDIASTTRTIPFPYPADGAETWVRNSHQQFEAGTHVNFGIILESENRFIGSVGLSLHREDDLAELGYWVGKPYWGQHFASEAASAVVRFAFDGLELNRVYASCLVRNPASRRVLEKAGLRYEGCLRQHLKKWDVYEDVQAFGALRRDTDGPAPTGT